uniref:Holin n=1 Tax=viral metagenome TaxID=1070528 RepID=A0A6H2A4R8_9ZZZZ
MAKFIENLSQIFADDKSQVILALLIIACIGMWKLTAPDPIISNIVAGLLGVAVGKAGK